MSINIFSHEHRKLFERAAVRKNHFFTFSRKYYKCACANKFQRLNSAHNHSTSTFTKLTQPVAGVPTVTETYFISSTIETTTLLSRLRTLRMT